MGMLQALTRADFALPVQSEKLYYILVTAHGVLMALVFTTFFIMGLGYLIARRDPGPARVGRLRLGLFPHRPGGHRDGGPGDPLGLEHRALHLLPAAPGPLVLLPRRHPPGGRLVGLLRGDDPQLPGVAAGPSRKPVPLAFHGMLVAVIIWILATSGLAVEVVGMLLPWSLGLIDRIDPIIARTWFWWFGHPLTYFWLLPAYVIWYTIAPRAVGGRLFSDRLARVVFVMFILFSTPVGFHHQFADPGISAGWKLTHTVSTYMILFPSLVTAFTVIASFELAGRLKGAKGLFDWLGRLPWREPFFASIALAMITFAVGGWGGAINAAYAMNTMVHNTAWIMGHFHLTVGTAVALSFLGVTYWLLPRMTGKELKFAKLASWQPYLWFLGMLLFAFTSHVTGLQGMPRRVYTGTYLGAPAARQWELLTWISGIGGVVLALSSIFFLVVVLGTLAGGRKLESAAEIRVRRRPRAAGREGPDLGPLRPLVGDRRGPDRDRLRLSALPPLPHAQLRFAGLQAFLRAAEKASVLADLRGSATLRRSAGGIRRPARSRRGRRGSFASTGRAAARAVDLRRCCGRRLCPSRGFRENRFFSFPAPAAGLGRGRIRGRFRRRGRGPRRRRRALSIIRARRRIGCICRGRAAMGIPGWSSGSRSRAARSGLFWPGRRSPGSAGRLCSAAAWRRAAFPFPLPAGSRDQARWSQCSHRLVTMPQSARSFRQGRGVDHHRFGFAGGKPIFGISTCQPSSVSTSSRGGSHG